MPTIPPELQQLADAFGVKTSYQDVYKRRQDVSAESVLAVLGTLGVDVSSLDEVPEILKRERQARLERGIEPITVLWDEEPGECRLMLPRSKAKGNAVLRINLENQSGPIEDSFDLGSLKQEPSLSDRFVTLRLPLPGLAWGYHQLSVETKERTYASLIISAPCRAYAAEASGSEEWGCFLPLYSLRSERNWGAGDFTDLHQLMNWVSDFGGQVVGTLPLLAAFLDEPYDPSPYAPASRLAWNEFYTDVTRVPELQNHPQLIDEVSSEAFARGVAGYRKSPHVDYRGIMQLKRRYLWALAKDFFEQKPAARFAEFEQFLKTHPHLEDYAEFRATYERQGKPWTEWAGAMREGRLSAADYDERIKQYHLYAQWIATTQLEGLAEAAGGGLYLDLPLGVRPDGYDVWRWSDVYASKSSAGSPPDAMWTKGQDWGFPPLHPRKIREEGYRHVRDYLKHHLRLARILRVDHVMQLHRLYWVPQGLPANRGAYVEYHAEEFYALLTLESHRSRTTLVGENLGTVPPEVNKAMDRHNLRRMYVVQYEIASDDDELDESRKGDSRFLRAVRPGALASLNTHDMPTFAAWWRGEDITLRQGLDLIDEEEAGRQREELKALRKNLTAWLESERWLAADRAEDEHQILRAILRFLSASEAGVVLVNLEDLWLETEPQNVPGTGGERPNWKRKAALTFEEIRQSPDVLEGLKAVAETRRQNAAPDANVGSTKTT
jgi:4-alpha-glucanotransferase